MKNNWRFRNLITTIIMLFIVTGCGGGGGSDTGGGSSNSIVESCSEANIYGNWRFTYSEDGDVFTGKVNADCTSMSGTIMSRGISGTWTAVKQ